MGNEDRIIKKIDMERMCRADLAKWIKIVDKTNFVTDLDAQDKVSLIGRGLHLKLCVLQAKEMLRTGEIETATSIIKYLARNYGQMFDKKEGRTDLPGSKDEPFRIEVTFVKPGAKDESPG
ncbi:MAG: hypothetical protein M0R06_00020 [Sphaerochaeta sp.]|jgi:hypothetical protein|nr:hypothetical protein [Sphaerochaeta sp.]